MTSSMKGGFLRDDDTGALIVSGGAVQTNGNGSIVFVGDSTVKGTWVSGLQFANSASSVISWPVLSVAQSAGRLRFANPPLVAQGGRRTADLLTEFLPQIEGGTDEFGETFDQMDPLPEWCAILIGTNDLGNNVALSEMISNYETFLDAIMDLGIKPIVCATTPRDDFSSKDDGPTRWHAYLRRKANEIGAPFVDFYAALVNATTGVYTTAYKRDDIHPNQAGHLVMATAFLAAMNGPLGTTSPDVYLTPQNAWSTNDTYNLARTNPLFLTDTNADGLADGVTIVSGGTGATYDLVDDPTSAGQYQRVTRGSNDVVLDYVMTTTGNADDRLYFAVKMWSVVKASAGWAKWELRDSTPTVRQFLLGQLDEDLPQGSFIAQEVARGTPGSNQLRFRVTVGGASGAKVAFALPTLINLTAAGIVTDDSEPPVSEPPAAVATGLLDNFTDTDNVLLQDHGPDQAPEGSGPWTRNSDTTGSGNFLIDTNEALAYVSSGSTDVRYTYSNAHAGTQWDLVTELHLRGARSESLTAGLFDDTDFITAPLPAGYDLNYNHSSGALALRKTQTNGTTVTTLGTYTMPNASGDRYLIKIEGRTASLRILTKQIAGASTDPDYLERITSSTLTSGAAIADCKHLRLRNSAPSSLRASSFNYVQVDPV